ncbi:MAG: hypothetical protein AAFS07_01655 [Pseudomonadota bacterium]
MKPGSHPLDPRGLIREAFAIEGIGPEDCRSIFFDWAIGLAADVDPGEAAAVLRTAYAAPEGHPMTVLLLDAATREPGGRRGGAAGRRSRP